ncbi:hypothetical protein VNO78_08252 [Psophocarpus tetragonolobus]|uniref:Uncharacterized protein n=1 Tax=Psophocarpus tetragonolobus TaxID=3891 RepID=A0AAN9T4V7_PSOTE
MPAAYLSRIFLQPFIMDGVTDPKVLILKFAMLLHGETFHFEAAVYFGGKREQISQLSMWARLPDPGILCVHFGWVPFLYAAPLKAALQEAKLLDVPIFLPKIILTKPDPSNYQNKGLTDHYPVQRVEVTVRQRRKKAVMSSLFGTFCTNLIWRAVELSEYGLLYEGWGHIKTQVLSDFVLELSHPLDPSLEKGEWNGQSDLLSKLAITKTVGHNRSVIQETLPIPSIMASLSES